MAIQITLFLLAGGVSFSIGWHVRGMFGGDTPLGRAALLEQADWVGEAADDLRKIQSRLVDFAHQSPEIAVMR